LKTINRKRVTELKVALSKQAPFIAGLGLLLLPGFVLLCLGIVAFIEPKALLTVVGVGFLAVGALWVTCVVRAVMALKKLQGFVADVRKRVVVHGVQLVTSDPSRREFGQKGFRRGEGVDDASSAGQLVDPNKKIVVH
jgi:hypothetical protein